MRSIKTFLTVILISAIAFCAQGEGEQYYLAYNDLLQGILDRGGIPSNTQPKEKGDPVTQSDLNNLRHAIVRLSSHYVAYSTYTPDTEGEDKEPFLRVGGSETDEFGRQIYIYRIGGEEKYLTMVPAGYTSAGKMVKGRWYNLANLISEVNFPNSVPVLWIHFQELEEILNQCKYKYVNLGYSLRLYDDYGSAGVGETAYGWEYVSDGYSDSGFTICDPINWRLARYGNEDTMIYKSWMSDWYNFDGESSLYHWYDRTYYSLVFKLTDFPGEADYSIERGDTLELYYRGLQTTYLAGQTSSTLYYHPWKKLASPDAETEYPLNSVPMPNLGYPPVDTSLEMDSASNSVSYRVLLRRFFVVKQDFDDVSITNPGKLKDDNDNGIIRTGCETCEIGKPLSYVFNKYDMSADIPLGFSSGFDSGLIMFSYLTDCCVGDIRFTHHNLNTYINIEGGETEPDGNKWRFTQVKRPRGAYVAMYWHWDGDTAVYAETISGNTYKMVEYGDWRKIIFKDGIVQKFSSGSGGMIHEYRKMEEDEILTLIPEFPTIGHTFGLKAGGMTILDGLYHPSGVVTLAGKSEVTYTDGLVTEVRYYHLIDSEYVLDSKLTIEYTTQTLANRTESNVYYVADASNIIDYSLFATETQPPQEVEALAYRYYKYIDGAYVLQWETRTSTDENGNPILEKLNVENGSVGDTAQKITLSEQPSGVPGVKIIQKHVEEGLNSFIDIKKVKAYPWGDETIEEIEGFGTDNEKTTAYDYNTSGSGYGKVKSISYPDGTWVRYEYDNLGRKTKEITPIGNVPLTAAENLCRVTEYDYNPYVTGDTVDDGDTRPRMTVQKELEIEVSRSYQGYLDHEYLSIKCQAAGAEWDADDNLVTYKYSYPDGDTFAGRHWKTVYPDGTMSITSYSKTTTEFTTTVSTGTGSGSTVTDGVRSISVKNNKDWNVRSQTVDIASGLTLSSEVYTHDDTGRVIRTDYPDGTYTTTAYACCGPSQEVNREGTATDIMYDTLKRVINTETDGIATLYTYDANDRVLTSTVKGSQGTERTTSNTYNTAGELTSTTTPDGETTTYAKEWIDGCLYETTTYPNGKTQVSKYNLDGTAAEVSGTAVRHVKYEYGVENGERYTKTINVGDNGSEANWTKTYTNFAGNAYKTVNSAGATILTEYDNVGRPIKQTAANGVITLTEYNAKGEVSASAVDMNQNSTIDYAGTDRINSVESVYESKSGKVVNKVTNSVYATDSSSTATVASISESAVDGSAAWQTNFGNVTVSQTTLSGSGAKSITVTNPDNSTVTTVYQNGRMTSSTHSVLGATTYTYDEFNRVSTVTHPEGGVDKVTTYTYNSAGQVATVTIASGSSSKVTSYTYNNMGARTSVTLPGGRVVNYTYTDTGELATVSGSDTYPQSYTYDALGRMKTLTTYRTYPGTPEVTTWNYDPASGFMTSKVYDDGKGTTYTYNAGGQLLTRVWDRGITTTYGYDNAGSQNSIDYSDTTPDISFTYNRMGQLATVTDASGTRTNTYDANLRLASSSIPYILSGNGKLEYAYDTLGRMSSMKLMENSTQKLINSYSYDAMSRIATVSDGTNTAEYTRLSGTNLLNSVVVKQGESTKLSTTKTYDAFNRLLSTSSVAGAATRTYTYEYNDKDQRTKLTLADGSYWLYTYDEKGQVTSGIKKDAAGNAIAGQSFNYTFDDIGNRKTATEGMTGMDSAYSSNNVNQYTQRTIPGAVPIAGSAATDATVRVKDADTGQVYHTTRSGKYFSKAVPVDNTSAAKEANLEIHAVKFDATEDKDIVKTISGKYYVAKTPQSFTYDNDGNMTSDGEWTYTWNGENRPVTVINADNTKKFEYKYDYAGRRIEEKYYTSTGTWTLAKHLKFVYKGFKKIAEYDGSDNLLKLYTWQPVDLDVPLWVKDGTTYYFYIVDGNKNVRSMVDASGNEVANYDYKPFGGIASQSGTYADSNMYRFSSEYYCPILKSSDFGLRIYKINFGRWLTRDPLGEGGGYNLYVACQNNPVDNWDLLGLKQFKYTVPLFSGKWFKSLVAEFNFVIDYHCKGGKVKYTRYAKPGKYGSKKAKTKTGIIPKKIYEDGSRVEFTLWAAGSWYEFNKKAGLENANRIIELFQADKSPRPVIVSIALGVYIVEGNLRAIKRTATFSKKVTIDCCNKINGKLIPIEGKDQFKEAGDLSWGKPVEYNEDESVTNPFL